MENEHKEHNYECIIENHASKIYQLPEHTTEIKLFCYTICTTCMYPFLMFLLNKTNDTLSFPTIHVNISLTAEEQLNEYFRNYLQHLDINYKGIMYYDNFHFFVVELKMNVNMNANIMDGVKNVYMVLPSEIINCKKIYNYPIDKKIIQMFASIPEFGLLHNNAIPYKIPDVAYKLIDDVEVNYYSFFKGKKENKFSLNEDYYYFYRQFNTAINRLKIDNNNCSSNVKKYIFRYAIFCENNYIFESNIEINSQCSTNTISNKLTLDDQDVNELLKNKKTLYICHDSINSTEDLLVADEIHFELLSFVVVDDKCKM